MKTSLAQNSLTFTSLKSLNPVYFAIFSKDSPFRVKYFLICSLSSSNLISPVSAVSRVTRIASSLGGRSGIPQFRNALVI